jgi:Anti-sigma-28 factor, FlgM
VVKAGLDQLAERIARGEYEVDPKAVAEAMLRRGFAGGSLVLVPAEPRDGAAVGAAQDDPAPGGDAA